jgi:hypothetical protein
MDTRAPFKKLWLLAILQAVRAAGIGTASSAFVHRLIYFTTALAVVSRQEPEVACVIKRDVGPYFPDYAWELERLVGLGLVTTRIRSADVADLNTHTLYKISADGLKLLNDTSMSVASLGKIIDHVGFCIRELAFAGVLDDQNSWAEDANQKSRTTAAGELIDYGEIQPPSRINYSAIEAAQLLGISIDIFESAEDASEALRRGNFWDQRENTVDQTAIKFNREYIQGLTLANMLSAHGPSLFARNLGMKRGKFNSTRPPVTPMKEAGGAQAIFAPPDIDWADEEIREILT